MSVIQLSYCYGCCDDITKTVKGHAQFAKSGDVVLTYYWLSKHHILHQDKTPEVQEAKELFKTCVCIYCNELKHAHYNLRLFDDDTEETCRLRSEEVVSFEEKMKEFKKSLIDIDGETTPFTTPKSRKRKIDELVCPGAPDKRHKIDHTDAIAHNNRLYDDNVDYFQ